MARPRKDELPKYLEFSRLNASYYYRNPSMSKKQNLGKDKDFAIEFARSFNQKHRLQLEKEFSRAEESMDLGAPLFKESFKTYIEKYIVDRRLKASTAQAVRQRRERIINQLGDIQVPVIDTQMLREAIAGCSPYEQSKMRTLTFSYFKFAKSSGIFPNSLPNPVDDLFLDPIPPKRRRRMTLDQFQAIYSFAPDWLQRCMVLAFHLALRRVDLVQLRFDDISGNRIISRVRKTDTDARSFESTSVSFPIHGDVRRVINEARVSSLRCGRCPFIIHRMPERKTKKASIALSNGTMEHPAQVLPDYASKAFAKARIRAAGATSSFSGMEPQELPTLHETRALSSHLYERAGYDVSAVQDLMAHTDPDMTRHYQRGHARKVLRVDMMLPYSVSDTVEERRGVYGVAS